jgi:xanthosine utilization system XapX-like protein
MAAVAILLGTLGALEAFDILNLGDAHLSPQGSTGTGDDAGVFVDGALLLIPGIIAALLAFTLHRNEHHERAWSRQSSRGNIPTTGNDGDGLRKEDDFWQGEHAGAYAAAVIAILLGFIGVLVGFHVFDEAHTFYDGLTWLMLSLLSSILAATLHSVGHHSPENEEHIVMLVEERVRGTFTGTSSVPGTNARTR